LKSRKQSRDARYDQPMASGPGTAKGARPNGRGARRLSRPERNRQLVAAAIPVVAAGGLSDFSLDEIAAGADVTRNLLYHYFPRGRPDVVIAVAEEAGHRLTGEWITDEAVPLAERIVANVGRMVEQAAEPSDAWRIYQLARGSSDRALRETVARFEEVVIGSISLNQLGTADPPPLVRIALRGYLAFFAAALDDARTQSIPATDLLPLLNGTLTATLDAATERG
jgi:AcrR family transcriptional regulator